MHFTVLCTLLGICVSTQAVKPRSINVALETVFEFDKPSDADFIDQVQRILNKVKNVLKDNPKRHRTEHYKFTNFVEDAINVLQSFNDEDLREIVLVVNNEIRKHLQGKALEEKKRRFLSDELNRFKIRPIKKIRKDLGQLLRKVKNDKHKHSNSNFLCFINTLYKRDSEQKLARFIRKLKMFRRNNFSGKSERLQQTVRRLLNSVIFEHFFNLPEDTNRKFVSKIEDYLHDAVYKDEDNNSSSQQYEIEAKKFSEVKNESNISSGELNDIERYESPIQDQNKSRVEEAIRDQSGSSKELIKKEGIGTSGETFSKTNNAKRNLKRNNKSGPSATVQRRYKNVKMKQTQYSKELEERSSGEIVRKLNPKYTKSKITHSRKLAKYPNLTNSRRKFTDNKTFYPKYIGDVKFKSDFRNTKHVHKGNIEKVDTDEILDDITLSSMSNSAEINVTFKNNKMQFYFKNKDDSVEDTVVRAKDSRHNLIATRAAEEEPEKPTKRQIDSQDHQGSIENRLETSKKRFKTVNRSRRLFKGHNNVNKYLHSAPKLVEYEQDNKFNINKIDNFKENVNTGKINIKKSPNIDAFRRRDYILAKKLIADKLNASKKLDQNEFYIRPQYAKDHTTEENKSREKFTTIMINDDISTQNKPDRTLEKASKNYNFVDDFHIAKTKPVKRFTTKEITYHEKQNNDNNIAVNTSDTSIRSIELTTENEPSYRRTKDPDKIDEVSLNSTRGNKNVLGDFILNNISNNRALFYKTSIANKTTDSYKKDLKNEYKRKLLNINAISTTTMNKIIESKTETKSKVFKPSRSTILVNTKPNTKSSTPINTNSNSEILTYELVTKPIVKINKTNEFKEKEIKSNVTKVIDSRRILSTPKTTTLINLDANLDDLAFEATMADLNTNIIEADSNFDIKKYLKNRGLPVGEDDPKNEIAKKMKEDLENIFTMPSSSASTTAAYTDIFEALENAFDL